MDLAWSPGFSGAGWSSSPRRGPTRRVAALAGALLLLAGGALWVATRGDEYAKPSNADSEPLPSSLKARERFDVHTSRAGATGLPRKSIRSVFGLPGGARFQNSTAGIVFMKGSRHGDIYEMNDDGTKQRSRVSEPGHDCGPAYSPDGRYLMYSSVRSTGASSNMTTASPATPSDASSYDTLNFDLYLIDNRTGEVRQLTTNKGIDFTAAWSPDGRRIAFATAPHGQTTLAIWVMNVDGSAMRQLTRSIGSRFHWIPAWSPDGTKIAFTSSDLADLAHPSLHVIDADGSNERVLTEDGGFPSWSPDGSAIAFASNRGQLPGHYDLYLMDPDGSHQRLLLHQEGGELAPSWSPDGRRLVYVQDPDGWIFGGSLLLPAGGLGLDVQIGGPKLSSIWHVESDGSNPVQLTQANYDFWPKYAPAGAA